MSDKCYYCGLIIEPTDEVFFGPTENSTVCGDCDKDLNGVVGTPGIRDWFAGMAMQALIMNPNFISRAAREGGMKPVESISVASYEMADAMLKQRNKGQK